MSLNHKSVCIAWQKTRTAIQIARNSQITRKTKGRLSLTKTNFLRTKIRVLHYQSSPKFKERKARHRESMMRTSKRLLATMATPPTLSEGQRSVILTIFLRKGRPTRPQRVTETRTIITKGLLKSITRCLMATREGCKLREMLGVVRENNEMWLNH